MRERRSFAAVSTRESEADYDRRMAYPSLRLFPSLGELSAEGRKLLGASVRHISCAGGAQLVARGDMVAGAYLVERGALRIYYVNAEGREGTLYWVDPGQSCILAISCVFSRHPYPAWVESEGETEISIVPGDVYRRLLTLEPAVQGFTFDALSSRIVELMALMEETASQGVEARVAAFLLRRSKGEANVEMTQEQFARHLSTSREVVSRVLRGLAARGLVETTQGRITLLDLNGLHTLTG
ncbi:Crp/Fnr family transcriptional regulator [Methylocystis sp. MJC1]|uniref:Crp/Fnr family transcriptional regulator n=1 Tax=Methylocystis sp. MJC1 TaxID=2654282 RepID=UPI0013EBB7FE|nr:Crp/Fnr family transcriptional regulator [Methylocystis sp. MJC1]KAF2992180.1 Transcriptional regulator SdrP [Methylocystis sp. MJC1]MBU6527320.1 Crp/Fnr family transcriptional regulator [Methylocystis sp. MJC1]UZX10271.1 Crp/Fnr family transcriptional regulator [Methylocystis sp. MJC1]